MDDSDNPDIPNDLEKFKNFDVNSIGKPNRREISEEERQRALKLLGNRRTEELFREMDESPETMSERAIKSSSTQRGIARGPTHTEEFKHKVSVRHKNRVKSPQEIENLKNALKRSVNLKIAMKSMHASRSPEKKQEYSKNMSEALKNNETLKKGQRHGWANLTPEQKQERINSAAAQICKPCTVDGVRIFNSRKDLVAELGQSKITGVKSPNFRYLTDDEVKRWKETGSI